MDNTFVAHATNAKVDMMFQMCGYNGDTICAIWDHILQS